MEDQLSDLAACVSFRLTDIRKSHYAPVHETWLATQSFLSQIARSVEQSTRKSIDHKKAIDGVRRSKVVDAALDNLLGIANGWNSFSCQLTPIAPLEDNLMSNISILVYTLGKRDYPLIDQNCASRIVATMFSITKSFNFAVNTDRPFPAFRFLPVLGSIADRFPKLACPDIGLPILKSFLPRKKLCVNIAPSGHDVSLWLCKVIQLGPTGLNFDAIVTEFIIQHPPQCYAEADDGTLSLPQLLTHLTTWTIENKSAVEEAQGDRQHPTLSECPPTISSASECSILSQCKPSGLLGVWIALAAEALCKAGWMTDYAVFNRFLWPLIAFYMASPYEDDALLSPPIVHPVLFQLPAPVWSIVHRRYGKVAEVVFRRFIVLAAREFVCNHGGPLGPRGFWFEILGRLYWHVFSLIFRLSSCRRISIV